MENMHTDFGCKGLKKKKPITPLANKQRFYHNFANQCFRKKQKKTTENLDGIQSLFAVKRFLSFEQVILVMIVTMYNEFP